MYKRMILILVFLSLAIVLTGCQYSQDTQGPAGMEPR
jgi:uncharacterized lipoprotein YehR (DUF1307 family)